MLNKLIKQIVEFCYSISQKPCYVKVEIFWY